MHLIVCYKEDRESRFKVANYLEYLKAHILNFEMDNIIIIGDFNGRIGLLNDNVQKKLSARSSDDVIINGPGKELIQFCNETASTITNGRLESGRCTYHALHGDKVKKSVIDYMIVSDTIFKKYKKIGNMRACALYRSLAIEDRNNHKLKNN